ncbi:cytochrome P450 [Russula compacta]|nr:cytochrome P450 [Russula compacta]
MATLLSILDFLALLSFFLALRESSWLAYTKFSKTYGINFVFLFAPFTISFSGDILSFHVFGKVIVVLNSVKATKDLLERRGEIYSDRPVIPFQDMMGWQWFLPTARYGESWRQGRKVLDRGLGPRAAVVHRTFQESTARVLLTRILASPDEWEAHVELLQGDLILAMTYGYEVRGREDRMMEAPREMTELGSATALPGALLINDLPFLWHIPEWLPWFSYKPLARYGRDLGLEVLNAPIQFVRDAMLKGTARPSLALENLQQAEKLSGTERQRTEETIIGL